MASYFAFKEIFARGSLISPFQAPASGGVTFPTTAGTGNDDFFVGVTADFKVNEV